MKIYLTLLITSFYLVCHSCSPADIADLKDNKIAKGVANNAIFAETAELALGKGYANKFFYTPTEVYDKLPSAYGLKYKQVRIPSTNNVSLYSWFIPSVKGTKASKLTVVYAHGTDGTMSKHVDRVAWLAKAGYNVLMFDYRGYGKSTGDLNKLGIIQDVQSAIRYTLSRKDIAHTKIVCYGHSLGGAKATAALGLNAPPARVKLLVHESSFASYVDMGTFRAGKTGGELTSNSYSPVNLINKVKIPTIIIHGALDTTIPVSQARKLAVQAKAKRNVSYWEVAKGHHSDCLTVNKNFFRKKLKAILNGL